VNGGNKYRIYTSTSIAFNQTFAEDSYSVKTLHDQSKMFENTSITKANPASFNFDVPLTIEKDESIVIDLLSDINETVDSNITTQQLKSFDVYVQTGSSTFKVENAVITAASFDFLPENQFTVRLQGEGTKLSRVGDESYSIPGSAQSESSTRTPLLIYPVVTVDSLDMSSILSTTIQLQNNITWIPFETLNNSLSVTSSSNAMFPSAYTLDKRIISGEIRQYQTDNNITQFDDFSTNSNISLKAIKVGQAANATPFLQWDVNPASYTARMAPGDVYTQSYDYRSLDNTNNIGTQITQYS
jgi:hypothetical protein